MGITLKQARFLKNVTQTELATALNINQRYISEAETGQRRLNKDLQKLLERFFGWPLKWEEDRK